MEIKNENKNLENKEKIETASHTEKEEKLSRHKKEYTVKRTFLGKISKEEMIRTVVQIFLESDTKSCLSKNNLRQNDIFL